MFLLTSAASAQNIGGGDQNPNLTTNAAAIARRQDAEDNFQQARDACGHCSLQGNLVRNHGLVYLNEGRKGDGERELHTALELNPQYAEAKELLRSFH